jgi:MFS family permease
MKPWLKYAIGAQTGLLVGMGLGRFSYTPMIPVLIETGHLSEAEAGYIGALNLGGYVIGALITPWLSHRFHEAWVIRVCLLVASTCLIASIFPFGFFWLATWRLSIGIIVSIIMILSISYVTRFAPTNRIAIATSIGTMGVGIGIFFSAVILPTLLIYGIAWGWVGSAVIGALATCIGFWAWNKAPILNAADIKSIRQQPRLSLDGKKLIAVQALFSIGLIPHSIYWVDYIVRGLGLSIQQGSFQWMLVGIGGLLGTVFWGRLADRIGLNISLVLVFGALASSIIAPFFSQSAGMLVFSSLVFGSQPGSTAIVAARAQQVIGELSMVNLWRYMVLSIGAAQIVGGFFLVELFNKTNSYSIVFLVGGCSMALAALICTTLTKINDPSK